MNDSNSLSHLQQPTRVRYGVLAFVCLLSMITYIDRAFWGSAQEDIRIALNLKTVAELGIALWAFQVAYALFEVPTGYLGDRYGPKKTLIRIVLWWSFFFSMTALVGLPIWGYVLVGFTTLVIVRFLFGMGEAGAYPNIARALYNWFPLSQRGVAQGTVWMSARFMGGLTPLLWLFLVDKELLNLHWRTGFFLLGGLGVIWCIAFALWFRNRPEEHPATNEAERQLIAAGHGPTEAAHSGVPWKKIFRSRNLWYICGMYVCANYGWYFFMYFLVDFMKRQFGGDVSGLGGRALIAILAGAPLLVGVIGCLVGGMLTNRHVRRTGDRKWGRKLYGMIGYALASGSYGIAIVGAANQDMILFALGVAMAGFFNDITLAPAWAVCQDIGRRYAAIVSGFMNMIGNLGGAASLFITQEIMKSAVAAKETTVGIVAGGLSLPGGHGATQEGLIDGYQINLILYASAYLIGIFFWYKIDASKPIVEEEQP